MRRNLSLIPRYRAVLSYSGMILVFFAASQVTPLLALLAWPREYVHSFGFILPALITGVIGAFLWRGFRVRKSVMLDIQEGGVIVFISWIIVSLVSSWPYISLMGFNFTQGVFESVSGWSGTGLTVMDVTKAPHVVLLWRSITQYAGGAGLAVIMLATIAGPIGQGLSAAEGRTEQLAPHVRDSAKIVLVMYSAYALFGIVALYLVGMTWFEAINHTFTALGTGGFSTKPNSIADFNSSAIEAVCMVLMILGATNFLTAYLLFQGKLGAFFRNCEVRTGVVVILGSAGLILLFAGPEAFTDWRRAFRTAFFEPISAISGTGFQTMYYDKWTDLGLLALILPMICGGGTGSTSGALKEYRVYVLFYSIIWEIRRSLMPRGAVEENYIWQGTGKSFVDDRRIRQAANYALLYIAALVVGTCILAAHGYSLADSLFEYASAQGTVGLSVGITKPDAPALILWTEIAGMFLGRLEFYVIAVSLVKIFRDTRQMAGI